MIFRTHYPIKKSLFETLIKFGAHIGDINYYKHFEHNNFSNILCIRNNFFVFDLSKTIVHLQRSLQFIYKLSLNYSKLLFYHSNIDSYFFKFIYFHLIRFESMNSFINIKFKGGFLSNYRQCFIRFINILSQIPLRIRNKRYHRKVFDAAIFNSQIQTLTKKSLMFSKIKDPEYTIHYTYNIYLFFKILSIMYSKTFLKRD